MIKVVGLGNTKEDLTLAAIKAINGGRKVIFKTSICSSYEEYKDIIAETLDYLYESATDFDELNSLITKKLLSYTEDIVYCVPGEGMSDMSVIKLSSNAEIEIIPGIGYDAIALSHLPSSKYISLYASEFINMRSFYPDTNFAIIIKEIDNCFLASDVKLILLKLLGDLPAVYVLENKPYDILISELDRQAEYDNTSICIVPPKGNYGKSVYNFSDLMEITYRLRDPDGCKWDRAQTHLSIRANAIEEAYELVEAIDLNDNDKMIEETGDVLLQGVFHAVIAENSGSYDILEVLSTLCNKLITRHTHIFGDEQAEDKDEALKAWEKAKAIEKGQSSYSDRLVSIADNLPSLIRAYKVQKTAKKSGFDWADIKGACDKVLEELNELLSADSEHREIEGGDLLFAAVNVLRFYDINPELALRRTVDKFIKRFKYMEEGINKKGKSLEESTLDEMDELWEEAKNEDRQ